MKKILIIVLCLLLASCKDEQIIETYDINTINVIDDGEALKLDLDLNSDKYLLFDVSNLKNVYAYKEDERMYPASLTKLMTLDVVLNCVDDLNDTSYITYAQREYLIEEDASMAGLQVEYDYSINDLLYALILPSGADGALALENYFESKGLDLVEQMNIQASKLGLTSSHFCNTTGLHDENHYSCLNDIFKIVMDVLSYKQGRIILETITYVLEDGLKLNTTLKYMRNKKALVLGGKTGYTPEAGQNICVLYRANNRSYILLLANAPRQYYKQMLHFDDSVEIFNALY